MGGGGKERGELHEFAADEGQAGFDGAEDRVGGLLKGGWRGADTVRTIRGPGVGRARTAAFSTMSQQVLHSVRTTDEQGIPELSPGYPLRRSKSTEPTGLR